MGLLSLAVTACRRVARIAAWSLSLTRPARRWVARIAVGHPQPPPPPPEMFARMAEAQDIDEFNAAANDLIEDSARIAHEVALATAGRRRRGELRQMDPDELADALYAMLEPSLDGDPDATPEVKDMFQKACRRYAGRAAAGDAATNRAPARPSPF